MNIGNLMNMFGGGNMMGGMGNGGMNPTQLLNMFNSMTGSKLSQKDIQAKMNEMMGNAVDKVTFGVIDMLYKEFPTEKMPELFKNSADHDEKVKILTDLVVEGSPNFLKKLKETDVDKLYDYLQKKK